MTWDLESRAAFSGLDEETLLEVIYGGNTARERWCRIARGNIDQNFWEIMEQCYAERVGLMESSFLVERPSGEVVANVVVPVSKRNADLCECGKECPHDDPCHGAVVGCEDYPVACGSLICKGGCANE